MPVISVCPGPGSQLVVTLRLHCGTWDSKKMREGSRRAEQTGS